MSPKHVVKNRSLDVLLVLATMSLAGQLLWPVIDAYRNQPRGGRQVACHISIDRFVDGTASTSRLDYLLYLPINYEAAETAWPLVVFLHGSGERGDRIGRVRRTGLPKAVSEGKHFPFVLVSPQCPANQSWHPQVVLALIDEIMQRHRIDRRRVYLTGFSLGGFGTWNTAAAAPRVFAAIVPVAGGGDTDWAKKLAQLPIWAFHGQNDNVVSVSRTSEMAEAIRQAGGQVKLTIYEDKGHGIAGVTYANPELYDWFLSHSRDKGATDLSSSGSDRMAADKR